MNALPAGRLGVAAFAVLCAAAAAGFLLFPTYPNYDAYYALLWGRELLDGGTPELEGFRVPTQHPLAMAVGAVLAVAGESADRLWVGACIAGFLWLVWGVARLAGEAFGAVAGVVAALLLLTRFDVAFLAVRGYVDVPYLALVVWAAVLERRRPRRGVPVLALLALAGLLRPEAWLLAAGYAVWAGWPRRAGLRRVVLAGLAVAAPVVWLAVDRAATGDALFSLHHTSSSAEELGRRRPLGELPAAVPELLAGIVKAPVLVAGCLGLVVALLAWPRRAAVPLALLFGGLGAFAAVGLAGLSVLERYLVLPAVAVLIFAAVPAGGWALLAPGRVRTLWAAAALAVVLVGAAATAARIDTDRFREELAFRDAAHASLVAVLKAPAVRAALRCGPLTTPNHKLVPDARWVADLPAGRVLARATRRGAAVRRGVALVVTSRFAIFRHAWTDPRDPATVQLPPRGFARVAVSDHVAAYARC